MLIWAHLCILIIKAYFFIPGKDPTQGLDDTTFTAEAQYSFNSSKSGKHNCLIVHYNGSNSYLFVNGVKSINSKLKILD